MTLHELIVRHPLPNHLIREILSLRMDVPITTIYRWEHHKEIIDKKYQKELIRLTKGIITKEGLN